MHPARDGGAPGRTESPGRSGPGGDGRAGGTGRPWRAFCRLADPKISLTSAASLYLGLAVAAAEGPVAWGWVGLTAAALFGFEVAKNAWGEVVDYDSGTDRRVDPADRTPFSGGKRVLVDGLLDRSGTLRIAAMAGIIGTLCGVTIVTLREPDALWIGLAGAALAWSYHGPPLRLAYRGWGEPAVALAYGPVIAAATCLVLTGRWSWTVIGLSLPLGLLVGAFLWVNEFPDCTADRRSGKRTLVVRLGRRRASRLVPVLYGGALALLLALPLAGWPAPVLLGTAFTLPAAAAARSVRRDPRGFHRHSPAQAAALAAFLLYAAGAGTGMLLA